MGLGTQGRRDSGMWGRGDVKTLGLWMWDVGTRGRDKQKTPNFRAEL